MKNFMAIALAIVMVMSVSGAALANGGGGLGRGNGKDLPGGNRPPASPICPTPNACYVPW